MEYRQIPGYRDDYLAGSDGHIYRLKDGSYRKLVGRPGSNRKYLTLWSYPKEGKRKTRSVHVLICLAYHGVKPTPTSTASHLNGDGWDNRPENLIWESQAKNLSRKNEHGTHDRGLNNSRSVLTPETLKLVKKYLEDGRTHQSIADELGVSRPVITRVNTGERYRD